MLSMAGLRAGRLGHKASLQLPVPPPSVVSVLASSGGSTYFLV